MERQATDGKLSLRQAVTIAVLIGAWSLLAGGLLNIASKEILGMPIRVETPLWANLLVLLYAALSGMSKPRSVGLQIASLGVPMILLFINGTSVSDSVLFITALIATPVTIVIGKQRNW